MEIEKVVVKRGKGLSKHPLYSRYAGMRARCNNPNHVGYHNYGSKGVRVCERWDYFENFLADMGEPKSGESLDRIDPNGDYEPGNCRWVTPSEQSRNTERNHYIEYDGKRLTVRDWELELGLNKGVLQRRVDLGWTDIDVVSRPINENNNHTAKLTEELVLEIVRWSNGGVTRRALARKYGVSEGTIYQICTGRGWSRVTGINYKGK